MTWFILIFGKLLLLFHIHNKKKFVTFVADYSCYTWTYFMHSKIIVFDAFKWFLALLDTQFTTSIKTLRLGSSGEYPSNEFHDFLQPKGIIFQKNLTIYSPIEWGCRKEKPTPLTCDWNLTLWSFSAIPILVESTSTVVHLINRTPSAKLQHQSPYFLMHGIHPNYNHLHTFGCFCFVHLPTPKRNKLIAQSTHSAFLGYASSQKGFLCELKSQQRFQ